MHRHKVYEKPTKNSFSLLFKISLPPKNFNYLKIVEIATEKTIHTFAALLSILCHFSQILQIISKHHQNDCRKVFEAFWSATNNTKRMRKRIFLSAHIIARSEYGKRRKKWSSRCKITSPLLLSFNYTCLMFFCKFVNA